MQEDAHQSVGGHLPDAGQLKDHAGGQNGDGNDHEEETGAAAGMVPGHFPGVLHGELQTPLVAEDGLMLGPVVLEGPVDVLHFRTEVQIQEEYDELHHTLQQVPQPHGGFREEVQQARGGQGGQNDEEEEGQAHAQDHRHGQDPLHEGLAAELGFDPLFELGGFFLLFRVELRRPHEGLHAVDQGADEGEHAPDEGQTQGRVLVLDELQFILLDLQTTLLVADHDGLLLRAAHHDALDEGLSTDGGAESAAVVLCAAVVFVFHSVS